jgi:hypothetical protein
MNAVLLVTEIFYTFESPVVYLTDSILFSKVPLNLLQFPNFFHINTMMLTRNKNIVTSNPSTSRCIFSSLPSVAEGLDPVGLFVTLQSRILLYA